jgi:hypothetical protein
MEQKQPSTLTQKALKIAGIGAATGALLLGGKRLLKKKVTSVSPTHTFEVIHAEGNAVSRGMLAAKRRGRIRTEYAAAKANHANLSERLAKRPNHSKLKAAVADAKNHMENLRKQLPEGEG